MLHDKLPFSAKLAFVLLNICFLVTIMYYGRNIFVPMSFAILFTLLLLPISRRLEKIGFPRVLAVFCTVALLVIGGALVLMLLMKQFLSFAGNVPLFIAKLNILFRQCQAFFREHFGMFILSKYSNAQSGLMDLLNSGEGLITNTLAVTTGLMLSTGLVIIYTFFFLLYRNSFVQFIYHLFPGKRQKALSALLSKIQKLIHSYILGILSVIFIIAVLNSIGLSLLHIENAILLGTIAAFFAIIPYIGVFVGALFPFLVAFLTKDSSLYAFGVLSLSVIVHLLEGNIITPYFVGRRVRINPLTAIVGMLAGEMIWGLSGIVLSIPIIAVIKSVLDTVPSLQAYGYILGLEISDDKAAISVLFEKIRKKDISGNL